MVLPQRAPSEASTVSRRLWHSGVSSTSSISSMSTLSTKGSLLLNRSNEKKNRHNGSTALLLVLGLCVLAFQDETTKTYVSDTIHSFMQGGSSRKTAVVARKNHPQPRRLNSVEYPETAMICAIQKDENPYWDEWADYHLALGFSIFIFDNSVSHIPLQAWQKQRHDDRIRVVHSPGPTQQMHAYKACSRIAKREKKTWITFIDIDEFFVLKKHDNIIDFAREYVPDGTLVINWLIMGTAGRKKYEDLPVTLRFPCADMMDIRKSHFKSLTRVEDLGDLDLFRSPHHHPIREGIFRKDTNGTEVMSHFHHGPRDAAEIYHFQYRSEEEHVQKRLRGDVYYGDKDNRKLRIQQAKNGIDPTTGKPLPNGEVYADLAWKRLIQMNPDVYARYAFMVKSPPSCELHRMNATAQVE